MAETEVSSALERLTGALDRLESAAARVENHARHGAQSQERLRDEVRAVIAEMDTMLGAARG